MNETRTAVASLAIAVVLAVAVPAAVAQQAGGGKADAAVDPATFERGRQLYDANCIACHQAGGVGAPPSQPALAGNDRLSDIDRVVRTIRLGQGGMLAFPQLTADEIAALATYVRNAWNNKFGAVAADRVATILAGLGKPADKKRSVWDGVYTAAQNERGEQLHLDACVTCHGRRLNGAGQPDMPPSPAIARAGFLRKWAGQTVGALFVYVCTKMPPDNPGTLNQQQCADAIAHMLAVSDIPAGERELPPDPKTLDGIEIAIQPKK